MSTAVDLSGARGINKANPGTLVSYDNSDIYSGSVTERLNRRCRPRSHAAAADDDRRLRFLASPK